MRILITGSSGFVGSKLIVAVEKAGHEVIGIDRERNGHYPIHKNSIIRDLIDLEEYQDQIGVVDMIIHCAAAKSDFGVSDDEYYRDNVEATRKLMDFAKSMNVRKVIYYSTVSVYGHQNKPVVEEDELLSNTIYGDTKLEGEVLVQRWGDSHPDNRSIILRPSVIYGENNHANMYNLMDTMYRRPLVMIGKGDHIKSMVALNNLVDLNMYLLEDGFTDKCIAYNCIDKPYLSLENLMSIIAYEEGFQKPKLRIPLWLAYLMATPFELISRLTGRDLKVNWNRLKKFSTSTDYRAEKIRDKGYVQRYSTESEVKLMATWYKTRKNG